MKKEHIKRVSLKDLARELQVSVSTVSRALKDSPEISAPMREKIRRHATERNYKPNPFAISLLKNSPRIIGIMVPDIVTHFYSSITSGINDTARQHGYSTIISSSYEKLEQEIRIIEDFINIRVDGVLACISQETTSLLHFEKLRKQLIPVVFYDRIIPDCQFPTVGSDNIDSAAEATRHLLDSGSHRVAFIGGANHLEIVKHRKRGYLNTLRERSIPIERELVYCREMAFETGYDGTMAFLNLPNPPDAILAMNDSIAFGAMRAIREKNLKIPDDIALVGYTDELHCNYVDPSLTGVTHQTYNMGVEACKLLLAAIAGETKITHIEIPSRLDIRNSSIRRIAVKEIKNPENIKQ